jgi:hypothetical protein
MTILIVGQGNLGLRWVKVKEKDGVFNSISCVAKIQIWLVSFVRMQTFAEPIYALGSMQGSDPRVDYCTIFL